MIEINRASPHAQDQSYLGISKRKKYLKMSIKQKQGIDHQEFETMVEEKFNKLDIN